MKNMPRRRLYSIPLFKLAENATTDYLEDDEVPQGKILYIISSSFEDETNDADTIAFGKKIGTLFVPFEEVEETVAGVRSHTDKTHHFIAGEKPSWRIEGATLNDVLRAYLEGYMEDV